MATARQLPSGTWRVRIRDNDDPAHPWKSFTAATPDEAEFLAAQYKFLKKKNARPEMRTLGACMDDYIDNRSNILSPSTIALYRLIRRTAFPNLVKFPVGKITPKMIQAAVNEYSANRSYKTVSNAVGFLKVVLGEVMPDFKFKVNLPQKERMGHATDNMLKRVYQHTFADESRAISERMQTFFEEKMGD